MAALISFEGKPSFTEAWTLYCHHFKALADVHELGRSKYTAFSWQNDPKASNSTIEDNIDALTRHISLHKAGYVQDAEGFPHVYHIACRIGMLLTTWYRQICWGTPITNRPDTFADCEMVLREYIGAAPALTMENDAAHWVPMLHITPEEIISCLKMYTVKNKKVRDAIDTVLDKEMSHEHFFILVLDMMHLQLIALTTSALPKFKAYEPTTDEQLLEERQNFNMTHITPCDILQYLSAKLHKYIDIHNSELSQFIRTPQDVDHIIKNYKKSS